VARRPVSVEPGIPDSAIPIEYRYQTRFAACLYGGAAVLVAMLLFGNGVGALLLVLGCVPLIGAGLAALLADPSGFTQTMGRKLIITDSTLEEVDERHEVRWQLRRGEVVEVAESPGNAVLPIPGADNWRADAIILWTGDGRSFRIPVWLLPHRGLGLRHRLESFLTAPPPPLTEGPRLFTYGS
jgi:hypothetical protein